MPPPSPCAVAGQDPGASAWILDRLAENQSSSFDFISRITYRARGVALHQPTIMLVLQGTKRIQSQGRTVSACAGDYTLVHRPGFYDMESVPEARGRPYRALVIGFPWTVVDLARRLVGAEARTHKPTGQAVTRGHLRDLRPEIEALLDAGPCCQPGSPVQEHRLLGILVALAEQGQDHFLWAGDPSVSSRVRALIAAQPGFSWESHHFEERLHMSGATLRRKLADEGAGLRELVRDARLHHGLFLLQGSGRPVKAVAAACGYRSVASFRRNFAERFGVSAARLAND